MAAIRIKEDTGILLDSLRSQFNVSSYDDVIKTLIMRAVKNDIKKQGWFGAFPGLKPYRKKEDRMKTRQ